MREINGRARSFHYCRYNILYQCSYKVLMYSTVSLAYGISRLISDKFVTLTAVNFQIAINSV